MLWDLHKARQRKRNRMLQLKREQKMGDFIDNMELARYFIDLWMVKTQIFDFQKDFEILPFKYKYFVCSKYKHEIYNTPLIKEHMHMDETWRLWLLVGKISGQANRAQEEAKRLNKQYKAVHALMRHKMRKCIGA